MHDKGFAALAGAVLLRAIHDTRCADIKDRQDAERFLRSEWAQALIRGVFDVDPHKFVEAASRVERLPPCGMMLDFEEQAA